MTGRGLGRCGGAFDSGDTGIYGRGCGYRGGKGAYGRGVRGRRFENFPRPWFDAGVQGNAERQAFAGRALAERRDYLAAELARMDTLIASTHESEKSPE